MHSRIFKFDHERVIGDQTSLPYKLIQTLFCHDTVTLGVRVFSMICCRNLSVDSDAKTDRFSICNRTKHKM